MLYTYTSKYSIFCEIRVFNCVISHKFPEVILGILFYLFIYYIFKRTITDFIYFLLFDNLFCCVYHLLYWFFWEKKGINSIIKFHTISIYIIEKLNQCLNISLFNHSFLNKQLNDFLKML